MHQVCCLYLAGEDTSVRLYLSGNAVLLEYRVLEMIGSFASC